MKTIKLLSLLLTVAILFFGVNIASAQTCGLPNSDFEVWKTTQIPTFTGGTIDYNHPEGWTSPFAIMMASFTGANIPVKQVAGRNGGKAVELGAAIGMDGSDLVWSSNCTQVPVKIKGYYRLTGVQAGNEAPAVVLEASKKIPNNPDSMESIGYSYFNFTPKNTWTYFEADFEFVNGPAEFDSVSLMFSTIGAGLLAKLQLDDIEIEYAPTSISKELQKETLFFLNKIYGQPELFVRNNSISEAKMTVYDLKGIEISSNLIPKGETRIQTPSLVKGMYLIRLEELGINKSSQQFRVVF